VTPGSPAEKAGLKGSTTTTTIDGLDAQIGGDVITAINGQQVRDFEDLTTYLARTAKVGDQVNLTVLRNGNSQNVTVTLAARPSQTSTGQTQQGQGQGQQGQGQGQQGQGQQGQGQAPRAGGVYLGVTGMTVTSDIASAMNLGNQQGVLVVNVVPGSPAEKAGLKGSTQSTTVNGQQLMIGGDVITAVDGNNITTVEQLVAAVQAKKAGDQVGLTILRNGQQQTINATLANRPVLGQQGGSNVPQAQPTPQAPAAPQGQAPSTQATPGTGTGSSGSTTPAAGGPWLGVSGIDLPAQMAQIFGLGNQGGVLVVNIVPGSPAEKAGIKGAGVNLGQNNAVNADVIVAVDGKNVSTMEQLTSAIQAHNAGDAVTLGLVRGGERQDVQVTLAARPAGQ
jgi:S1-C subfamily serine protease